MSTVTPNYNLEKPAASDYYDVGVQNGNMDRIDSALSKKSDLTLSNLSDRQKALANIGGRPRKNLIRNWYFVGGGSQLGYGHFPINQKGNTSFSESNEECFEGWVYQYNTTPIYLRSAGLVFVSGASTTQVVRQGVLQFNSLRNKKVTISGLFTDNTLIEKTLIIPQSGILDSGPGSPNGIRVNVYSLAVETALQFRIIGLPTNGDVTCVAVKLEEGEGQTLAYKDSNGVWQLFETPDYLETLQQCQRYLYLQPLQYGSFAGYLSSSATEVFFSVPVGVQMEKTLNISYDSVTIFNESGIIFNTQNGGVFTPSAIMPDGNSVYVRASLGAAVGTANQCVACQIAGLTITGTD